MVHNFSAQPFCRGHFGAENVRANIRYWREHFGAENVRANMWYFLLTLTQSPNPK